MKNVNPMVGQVWENIKSGTCDMLMPSHFKNMDIEYFLSRHKFLPRTDLEWLVCNFNSWTTDLLFIWKKGDACYATSDPKVVVSDCYTRQQWQGKRYELGLDEAPGAAKIMRASINRSSSDKRLMKMPDMDAIDYINECFKAYGNFNFKKETKMIDLKNTNIGDEYLNEDSQIVTMVMQSDNEHQFVGKVGDSLSLYNVAGMNYDKSCQDLVSKYEPHHWLKDLPDAAYF